MSSSYAMACTDDEKQAAVNFAEVFCTLLDKHRNQLATYLADDALLDWFGHTISSKDSIAGFMKLEVPETVHRFTSVEPSGPIQHRKMALVTVDEDNAVMPSKVHMLLDDSLSNDDLVKLLDNSNSVAEVSCSEDPDLVAEVDLESLSLQDSSFKTHNVLTSLQTHFTAPVNSGIPVASEIYSTARHEGGQGACHPETSVMTVTKVNRFLEACGSVQFQRTKQPGMAPKNMRPKPYMKWSRFCKLQIAYSISPNTWFHGNNCDGISREFKIWLLIYQDYAQCRRNLSEAFDRAK
jgi:hypothetical protein